MPPADFLLPSGGLSIRHPDNPFEQERRLFELKLPAAQAFARANGLDRLVASPRKARYGIAATGKAYLDFREAVHDLNQALSCGRVGVLSGGRLVALGAPREALTVERIGEVFGVRASIVTDPADGTQMFRFHS